MVPEAEDEDEDPGPRTGVCPLQKLHPLAYPHAEEEEQPEEVMNATQPSSVLVASFGGGTLAPQHHNPERVDRGATWSDPEVDQLLNIWTNAGVQTELKEATIKKHIFERIALGLRDKGFFRTAEQCREKIKRLKKEYKQAKSNNYRCVRGRATVKFFPRLQAILEDAGGALPVPITGVLTTQSDSSSEMSPLRSPACSSEEIKVDVNPAEVDRGVPLVTVKEEEGQELDEEGVADSTSPVPSPKWSSAASSRRTPRKVRRRGYESRVMRDVLDSVMDRFLDFQEKSEERFYSWEERRLRVELEAEERWRHEDRQVLQQLVHRLGAVEELRHS